MPNWVFNQIRVTGDSDRLDRLVSHLLQSAGLSCDVAGLEAVRLLDCSVDKLHLSSFDRDPYPETFLRYDTTNHPDGARLKVGDPYSDFLSSPSQKKTVTEETIEEFRRATAFQRETYGVVGWYDFNLVHFGCKWDSTIGSIMMEDDGLHISVDTPWSPPEPWLARLSAAWGLTFANSYEEEANLYGPGVTTYEGGEVVSDTLITVYRVFYESFYGKDEREDALARLTEITGIDVPEGCSDAFLLSEGFQARLEAWSEQLPEDSEYACWEPLCIINPD